MVDVMTFEENYETYKNLLFSLAYRMLGSVMDAEDVVQEAFIELNRHSTEPILNMKAYLCKIATNRCIDRLRSASKQREVYVGPWLPEPLITEETSDPALSYLMKESISTAYLLLLQQLSWVERAVFLLREVLQYDYDEIAEIVGKSTANCRQICHRAKRSMGHSNGQRESIKATMPKMPFNTVIEQFVQALSVGDKESLLKIISSDATLYSDGGGKVFSAVRPIQGAERIIGFFLGLLQKQTSGFSFKFALVNGQIGIISYINGQVSNVTSFHYDGNQMTQVYIVTNPDKLMHLKR